VLELRKVDGTEIPLSQIATNIGVDYNTVWLWARHGRKGVKLRVCHYPYGMASTMEEYHSFLRRLNEVVELSGS
jgi:hypothetical protein